MSAHEAVMHTSTMKWNFFLSGFTTFQFQLKLIWDISCLKFCLCTIRVKHKCKSSHFRALIDIFKCNGSKSKIIARKQSKCNGELCGTKDASHTFAEHKLIPFCLSPSDILENLWILHLVVSFAFVVCSLKPQFSADPHIFRCHLSFSASLANIHTRSARTH